MSVYSNKTSESLAIPQFPDSQKRLCHLGLTKVLRALLQELLPGYDTVAWKKNMYNTNLLWFSYNMIYTYTYTYIHIIYKYKYIYIYMYIFMINVHKSLIQFAYLKNKFVRGPLKNAQS